MRVIYRTLLLVIFTSVLLPTNNGLVKQAASSVPTQTVIPIDLPSLPTITANNVNHLEQLTILNSPEKDNVLGSPVWSPDGKLLVVVNPNGLWLFEIGAIEKPPRLLKHSAIWHYEFSSDGALLITQGYNGAVQFWDLPIGQQRISLGEKLKADRGNVKLSPDGSTLAVQASHDQGVALWNVATGEQRIMLRKVNWPGSFSPDGALLALTTFSSNEVVLYKSKIGQQVAHFQLDDIKRGGVRTLEFSPKGNIVAIGGGTQNSIWLWDHTNQQYKTLEANYDSDELGMAFSANGEILASWGRSRVDLWQVSTGKLLAALAGHGFNHVGATFNPSSTLVASWDWLIGDCQCHRVRLWDTQTGNYIATLAGQNYATFNPAGNVLATGSDDGRVVLWGIK
jgi:WD40 repeat protein